MTRQTKILVVDDEQDLCEILLVNLTAKGYLVDTAHSAEEALEKGLSDTDLILLDVMMGGMSGFEMAKLLKGKKETAAIPIIFLTARDAESDTLEGFDLGADDYIAKPFSIKEVLARVRAVLNRTDSEARKQPQGMLTFGRLSVDCDQKTATLDGRDINLTKTEQELLLLFLNNEQTVFSRQELMKRVWPQGVIVTDRTIDVNITRLRKKIGIYAQCIVTRQGYGYGFDRSQLKE